MEWELDWAGASFPSILSILSILSLDDNVYVHGPYAILQASDVLRNKASTAPAESKDYGLELTIGYWLRFIASVLLALFVAYFVSQGRSVVC